VNNEAASAILEKLLHLDVPMGRLMDLKNSLLGQPVGDEISSILAELVWAQIDAIKEIVKLFPELEPDKMTEQEEKEMNDFINERKNK
jgi:hypothetical protein